MYIKLVIILLILISGCSHKDPHFMDSKFKPKDLENGKAVVIGSGSYKTYEKAMAGLLTPKGLVNTVAKLAKDKKFRIDPQNVIHIATLTFERQPSKLKALFSDNSSMEIQYNVEAKKFTLGNLYGENYEINTRHIKEDFAMIIPGRYKLIEIGTFDYNGKNRFFGTHEGIQNIVKFPPSKNMYFEVQAGEVLYIGDLFITNEDETGINGAIKYNNINIQTSNKSDVIEKYLNTTKSFAPLRGKMHFKPLSQF